MGESWVFRARFFCLEDPEVRETKKTLSGSSNKKQKNNLPQILTLVVACGVAALVASIGVYSPNRAASMAAAKVREAAAKAAKAAAKP